MSTYRVLTIDGGGIRGLIPAILLERIVGTSGLEGVLDSIDLIAGTSTGGLEDPRRRTWKPKLFHNFPGRGSDRKELAYKVGLYTSAAPTYFPSVEGFVDGGVYANNPSMCALAQTQDRRYEPTPPLEEVTLLSLGTGASLQYIKGRSHDWGYAQWVKPLISLMMDGTVGIADYHCQQVLNKRYHRLAPVFPAGTSVALDDVRRIPDMIDFAESVPLGKTVRWLRKHWA